MRATPSSLRGGVEHWTPVNGLTEYTYDDVGNLKAIDHESTTNDIAFNYDALNRLTSMADLAGTTTSGWTAWGALASGDGPWADDTVAWDYNAAGQRSELTVDAPNGSPWEQIPLICHPPSYNHPFR